MEGDKTERSEVYSPETNSSTLKIDGWKITFLLGYLFSGAMLYSFREGILAVLFFRKDFATQRLRDSTRIYIFFLWCCFCQFSRF